MEKGWKNNKNVVCQPPDVPCRNPGLNQGPLDLQSNALPTELFRLAIVVVNFKLYKPELHCPGPVGIRTCL